jgi:hypothetical protein
VLVFPEAFGLGDHAKGRAERIAGLGYVVLACDLHGDGRTYTQLEEVMPLLGPLMADPSRTRARAGGGLKALRTRPTRSPRLATASAAQCRWNSRVRVRTLRAWWASIAASAPPSFICCNHSWSAAPKEVMSGWLKLRNGYASSTIPMRKHGIVHKPVRSR